MDNRIGKAEHETLDIPACIPILLIIIELADFVVCQSTARHRVGPLLIQATFRALISIQLMINYSLGID